MARPEIIIGDPHSLVRRARVALHGIDIVVPVDQYENANDALLSAIVLTLAGVSQAVLDLQTVAASLAPKDTSSLAMLADHTTALAMAVDRIHTAVDARAAAQASEEGGAPDGTGPD